MPSALFGRRGVQVYRDALHPAVFAVGMRDEQLDRLFRAPDRAACERWVRAIRVSMLRAPAPVLAPAPDAG